MHPLSIPVYYKRNLWRISVVIMILSLSLLAVLAIAALTGSFRKEVETGSRFYENYYLFTFSGAPTDFAKARERTLDILEEAPVASQIEGDFLVARKEALTGGYEVPLLFLSPNDREKVMQRLNHQLGQGEIREGENSLVLTTPFMDNRDLEIGSKLGDRYEETEYLSGDYQVTGTVSVANDQVVQFLGYGSVEYSNQNFGSTSTAFYITPEEGRGDQLDARLSNLKQELKDQYPNLQIRITTAESFANLINKNFRFMDIMVASIMSILVVVITTSVALFNVIVFMQRASEFGLLLAMGYSRGFILRKTLLESIIQILLSLAIGFGLSWILFIFLNLWLFAPNGFAPLILFTPRNVLFALPIPLAVAVFSIVTILIRITRLDPISILERRD